MAAHEHYERPYVIAPPYLPQIGLRGVAGCSLSSRRRIRRLNTYLVTGSKEIDELYERGEIPLAPPSWEGPLPDSLNNLPTG